MSLRPLPAGSIPEETQRVAHGAFPKGTLCLRIADELGPLYGDDQFADLFPTRGQPAASPARLALTSVLQYVEGLSDRQAADAVRGRIDWKYALALELTDPGFDHTVLSEFRSRLVQGQAELQLLDTLLQRCRERGLIRPRGRQRTDSTHVLAAVRVLNRLERVGETMRAALNDLAVMAPTGCKRWPPRSGINAMAGGSRTTTCRRPMPPARSWPESLRPMANSSSPSSMRRAISRCWRSSRRW